MTTAPEDHDLLPQPTAYAGPGFRKGIIRDREAARLAALGWDLRRIGEHLGLDTDPEHTESRAAAAVRRALAAVSRFATDESRILELAGLQEVELYLWRLLNTRVVLVQHGRIVSVDNKPLEDHRFALEVIDRLTSVKEQKAKLMGWNAPTKTQVITADSIEDEIKKLKDEIARNAASDLLERQFPNDNEAAG